ncbi:MAG: heavy metal-binding domain-containing protein [Planctomycetota bacterium]
MADLIINLVILGVLIALGFFAGGYQERRHFKRLVKREEACRGVVVTQMRSFPGGVDPTAAPTMVAAEAVIASDYFKSFLSGIRKFFGGELGSYLSLLERARREAQVRLQEQAQADGLDTLCNVRMETVDIGGATNPKRQAVTVAILATATAYKRRSA